VTVSPILASGVGESVYRHATTTKKATGTRIETEGEIGTATERKNEIGTSTGSEIVIATATETEIDTAEMTKTGIGIVERTAILIDHNQTAPPQFHKKTAHFPLDQTLADIEVSKVGRTDLERGDDPQMTT
jgi:hypothetical protein